MIDLGTLKANLIVDGKEGVKTLKEVGSNSGEADGKLAGLGNSLKKLGIGVTIAVALKKVADAIIDCTKSAIEFEENFAKVNTLLDPSNTNLEKYKEDIISLSNATGVATEELTESIYSSISAGIDQGDAIDFTSEALKLAKGGFTDTSKAVDILTTALNGYGLETEETTRVSDILISTQNLGKTTVDELAGSMGAVIPVANNANVGIEELGASYALLTQKGIGTAEAGTMLKAMFGELTKAGSITDDTLKELTGKGFAELEAEGKNVVEILSLLEQEATENNLSLKDMFGSVEAGTAALTLMSSGGEEYNQILTEMSKGAGATEQAYSTMTGTVGNQMEVLKTNFENVKIQIGDTLLPALATLGEFALGVIQAFSEGFTWLTKILSDDSTTIGAIWQGLSDTIALVFDTISSIIGYFVEIFKKLWEVWGDSILWVLDAVFTPLKGGIDIVLTAIKGIFDFFTKIITGDWQGAFEGLRETFYEIWEKIKNNVKEQLDNVVQFFTEILPKLLEKGKEMLTNVWDGLKYVWENLGVWLSKIVEAIVTTVTEIAPKMFDAGKKIFTNLWDGIKNIWKGISDWVTGKVDWLVDKITFWDSGKSKMAETSSSDGSHRTGLLAVPFDGYRAVLHKGERVLTQPEAQAYQKENATDKGVTINNTFNNIKEQRTAFEVAREQKRTVRELGLC